MSLLCLCQCWFGDTIGGSFFLATEQARALAQQGHHVIYLCCGLHEEPEIKIEKQEGVEIWRYPLPSSRASGISRLKHHSRWTRHSVEKMLEREKIESAYGHSPLQSQGFLAARGNDKIPFCYQVHSPFPDEVQAQQRAASITGRMKTAMAKRIEKKLIRRADVIVGCSQFTKSRLVSLYGESLLNKYRIVPGVVDVEKFQPSSDRHLLRESLPEEWQTDKTIFFTLRRLERRMGVEDFVRAAGQVSRTNDQFRVLIGGSGSMREELETLVDQLGLSNVVSFLGRIPDESLASCYAAADCFVLPTRALECFGLIVLEAFACRTPVIGSDAGAIPELVGQQSGDWSFPSGNAEILTERMQQFLSGDLKADVRLREIALQYSYERIVPLWCETVKDLRSEPAHA